MIAPRSRLLFWTGMVLLPAGFLAAAVPPFTALCALAAAAFLVIAALDATASARILNGIRVETPPVIRLTKGRQGLINITIHNDSETARALRLGLALPVEMSSANEYLDTMLPSGARRLNVVWPCTALKRGNYALDRLYFESGSRLGFWAVRSSAPIQTEIRVYPNLAPDQKTLAALFLNRGGAGIHSQRQIGRGRDFEKLREYIPGDDFDEIHWKATAKRSRPVTKVFQIERTQEVYVVLDASRLSARELEEPGGAIVTQFERFVNAALVLGQAAERQGDLYGVLAYADKVQRFVRARSGKAHYGACRDALYALEPQVVNPDFDELCSFIRLRMRRRALLLFLTNLDDPVLAESFVRSVELVARQHLVLVSMPTPPGVGPIFSGPDPGTSDALYGQLGGHMQWHTLREVQQVLRRRGVGFELLNNERMCAQLVTQYLSVKQRQAL
ncbi:MAG: DUF58 domain-containing protein [Candidatus Hydrogenedentes bacterium]|nr:DUF58 domain-containing protein [Candidatus Hydrogenedentota bacterium]